MLQHCTDINTLAKDNDLLFLTDISYKSITFDITPIAPGDYIMTAYTGGSKHSSTNKWIRNCHIPEEVRLRRTSITSHTPLFFSEAHAYIEPVFSYRAY